MFDSDPAGNTKATAIDLGTASCDDSTSQATISGAISSGGDVDWYVVHASGGAFCVDDWASSLSCANGCAGIAYDVLTDRDSISGSHGSASRASGFYSDGANVYIAVYAPGATGPFGGYNLQFHL